MITAIETTFDGRKFRSRTEARWAVFFRTAGIRYDYEPEGVILNSGPYLPDFWLPDAEMYLEVKGTEPTVQEEIRCQQLAIASDYKVLLAIGPPNPQNGIILFTHTRPVRSVDGDVRLNRALWTLAEEMAKIKNAA